MHVCRHRAIALSFHSKERRTNSVLLPQLFSKGVACGSPGEGRFRETSDDSKALLAEAHMVLVSGLFTVVVLAAALQTGSEKKWYWAARLRVWQRYWLKPQAPLCPTEGTGQTQAWCPALPYTCVLGRKETLTL